MKIIGHNPKIFEAMRVDGGENALSAVES